MTCQVRTRFAIAPLGFSRALHKREERMVTLAMGAAMIGPM